MSALQASPRISPFLWFDQNAEEAVAFYTGIFPNSRQLTGFRSPVQTSVPEGKILVIDFELNGQKFTAMNGGPEFKFTKAISFVVTCEDQHEIDHYWAKLSQGGKEIQCGWLEDRFGLAWQIVPSRLGDLLKHPNAMLAMMQMVKLNIAELEQAGQS
ncbi:VOC family protein [Granulicella arctica]|uniref:VOC family protein n=1 Tax=Granulicella arctica TaxID=940613 RepID=UPI0021DFF1C4|nr:VOC family protein [Granulicella arctica]